MSAVEWIAFIVGVWLTAWALTGLSMWVQFRREQGDGEARMSEQESTPIFDDLAHKRGLYDQIAAAYADDIVTGCERLLGGAS